VTLIGAPKRYDVNILRPSETSVVRTHMAQTVCGVTDYEIAHANTIVLIKRQLTSTLKKRVDNGISVLYSVNIAIRFMSVLYVFIGVEQDHIDDHPSLRRYYDGGPWGGSVLASKRILGDTFVDVDPNNM
jgi:hypothetical protein